MILYIGNEPGVKPTDPTDDDNFFIYIAAGSGTLLFFLKIISLLIIFNYFVV